MALTPLAKFSRLAAGSTTWFARKTLVRIASLLALAFSLMAVVLVKIALGQNELALEQSTFYAEKALKARQESQLRSISDYAFWGDAYKHLHAQVDIEWAYTRRNLGPSLFEDFGYEGIFVIAPNNETVYAVIEGRLVQTPAQAWLQGDVSALVEQARRLADAPEPTIGAFRVAGQPALVAAAAFTQGGDPTVADVPGAPSVLLFVDRLTPAKLASLGKDFALPALRQPRDALDAGEQPSLLLSSAQETPILLRWTPQRPGDELLVVLLPLLGLAGLIVAGLGWLVTRQSLAAARRLDASYASLQASEARFQDIAEAASDWLWETDDALRFTFLSRRFEAVTGHNPDAWIGRPLTDLLQPDTESPGDWRSRFAATATLPSPLQCSYLSAAGKYCLCNLIVRSIQGPAGPSGYRGTASDTTALTESQLRVRHLQRFDELTGLPNRNHLIEVLEQCLDALKPGADLLTLLAINLASFKQLNDRMGRTGGDQVLIQVAQRLERFFPPEARIFRYTSDEFVVLLEGALSAPRQLDELCRQLIAYLERPLSIAMDEFKLGVQIGIATAPRDAGSAQGLLRCSEIALHQARTLKPGNWCFFSRELERQMTSERQLELQLRHAIANDELRLHFQPRHRARDMQLSGVEALVRWQHPQRGLIGPGTFIPLAERSGLIVALGSWVLREACTQARSFGSTLFVSVNLSAEQFRSPGLVAQVRSVLEDSGLPADRLELEITESMMLDDAQGALETLKELNALGVRLSMDDFGTGYSSLSYLGRYPFDTLKIDRSFVAHLNEPGSLAIVRAIVELGHALSMTVTAEGVENAEQLELLRGMGCDELQGFHLGRPVPAESLHEALARRAAGLDAAEL
ncbi:EAL domain-containing protein [Metapseudomonas furukawaii]|uniref:bifunctional diguanylate cyclase/phosphodiesterase n=1 Tax=Metapseudomonas furukawaii TaxID=1149133 RepID=UPI00227A03DE|nr:EAL domain-containing protein [Pseudomonas furukawaii]WAG81150.1 EAL domain-containing protein [Pseudomonas furukawaii]